MKILVLNGVNLNLTGLREKSVYGTETLETINAKIAAYCKAGGDEVDFYQSNHEGALVDAIQQAYNRVDGIVINPAAYTHTSIALLDALKAVGLPAVEVHISNVAEREDFRQVSYVREWCEKTIAGHGFAGYLEAMDYLVERAGG